MKQKNAIILLTVMLILLSIYRLSFTLTDRAIQQSATEYATDKRGIVNLDKKQKYLDSLWNKPVYNVLVAEYTYKEVKEMSLSLGLDLQGGMHVTLEVSPVEIIKALANNSRDAKFQQALALAQKRQATSQASFVSLFGDAYAEVAPGQKLSKIFTNTTTRGKIDLKSTNAQILDIINQEMEDAFDRSFNIIRTRIDKFGVSNPTIQKLPGTNRILVELPGVDNPKRVRKLLSGVAKLEFWEVWETQDLVPYYQEFAAYLEREESKNQAKTGKKPSKGDGGLVAQSDSNAQKGKDPLVADEEEDTLKAGKDPLVADEEDTTANARPDTASKKTDSLRKDKPKADSLKKDTTDAAGNLAAQLMQPSYEGFVVRTRDTARVNELLSRSEVQRLFPSNLRFMWDVKANEAAGNITLYAIKTGRGGKAPLSGEVVIEARNDFDENNRPSVSMQMNATGARGWRKLTAENVGKRIAIALDNYVYSAPRVNGEIPNGSSVITGNFTVNEAKDLANVLKAGKLPAPVRVVEEATVGPSLGKESIQQGLNSMLLGLGLVIVFMILYYRSSGIVANIALFLNIFLIIGMLAQVNAVLTLPGIAGIVLTIGMSVDANVLIFERIKEELAKGRTMRTAVTEGFSRAMSSIIDSNATTFLIGLILFLNGTGAVKGFATTLMIGILCSLFCAIFITRLVIEFMLARNGGKGLRFDGFIFRNTFKEFNINFVKLRRPAYIASLLVLVVGMATMIYPGLSLGVDFKGGRSYVIEFNAPISVKEARQEVIKKLPGSVEVKTFGGNNKLKITTSYLIEDESPEADQKVQNQLMAGLKKFENKQPQVVGFSKVGATIADDIAQTAYIAVGLSFLAIFIYIFWRIGEFKLWQYGVGALVALVHDVLILLGLIGIAKLFGVIYEIDQVFIAALLTLVGYSINDTVVVFDRIKENLTAKNKSLQDAMVSEQMNEAINVTLSRTIMTSGTTVLVVLMLFLFGGEVLSGFSFSLLVGILVGTYSSIFVASPVFLDVVLWSNKLKASRATRAKRA